MTQKNILNCLRISEGTPHRISKKWLYILNTCWKDIFDNELFISYGQFFLGENNIRLIMNISLPPVTNRDSHFKNDDFMISLSVSDINYRGNIQKILEKEVFNVTLSIEMIEHDLFEIIVCIQGESIIITSHDVMILSLSKKKDEDFLPIY